MASLTLLGQKLLLDHTIGLTSYTMPTVHLGLFTASPGETGSLAGEPSGGSYARVALASKLTATVLATGLMVSSALIQFPSPSAAWGTVAHWGVCDAASAGNVLLYGPLTNTWAVNAAGIAPSFLAGAFQITASSIQTDEMTQYLAKKWLDHILGIASFTAPSGIYLGLAASDPGATGSLAGELVGGGYGRQALTPIMGETDLASGLAVTEDVVAFSDPTADWDDVSHEFVADAASAGNVLWRRGRESVLTVLSGSSPVRIDAGQLALRAA